MTLENFALYFACTGLLLYAALQFSLLTAELPGPFFVAGRFDIWCLHHDEKLIVPDLRLFALPEKERGTLQDYAPYPVSAAFGLLGPWLSVAGIRLFGFSNAGLRVWSVVAAVLRQALFLSVCFQMLPAVPAAAFFCLQLFSVNDFILDHHAILENLLHLALVVLVFFFVSAPAEFATQAYVVGLGCAALVLMKPNFPVVAGLLAFCLLLTSGLGGSSRLVAGWLLGLVVFEGAQDLILWRLGLLSARVRNFLDAIRVHAGFKHEYLQKHFLPVGWRIFLRFPVFSADWLTLGNLRSLRPYPWPLYAGALLFYAVLALGAARGGGLEAGLALCIVVHLAGLTPFFYYPKRVTFFIPLTFLALILSAQALLPPAALQWLWLPAVVLLAHQGRALMHAIAGRNKNVEVFSRKLEELTFPGATVVMHCYPYRFTWQTRCRNLLSGDDQVVNNRMCEARAVKADYLILADLDAENRARLCDAHLLVGAFTSSATEADIPMRYDVFKITQGNTL
ncbi:MAG: hypothetical protein P4L39_10195 [Humidesulfovibrio sp.]|nr:hypothetical protein [Humidesulfovibrio sp.]